MPTTALPQRLTPTLALLPLLTAACTTPLRPPDLGDLYTRAAKVHDTQRNPVIVIPGILGSKLVDEPTGRVVWGAFAGGYANPQTPDGARLVALPMQPGRPLRELRDDVRPAGVLDRLRVDLLFMPVELKAYLNILATLGVGGYRDELLGASGAIDYGDDHFTCFQFDYDWRRDNAENARRLHDFILEKRAYVETELTRRYGPLDQPVRFDIVAHSMGGLITRYFLRYGGDDLPDDGDVPPPTWAGAELVEKVILVGTPNAGSVEALRELVDGSVIAPVLPTYPPAVLGTMPSVYQLLPRPRHACVVDAVDGRTPIGDFLDPKMWEQMGWGLASPRKDDVLVRLLPDVADAAARRRIALDHLHKCLSRARRFFEAIDSPAPPDRPPPPHVRQYLFAGDAVPTDAVLAADRRTGALRVIQQAPGDRTVLRSSALMDERLGGEWSPRLITPIGWTAVQFIFADHLGLTKDPAFSDNVLFLLLESPN